jgi:hypothetical protein
MHGDWVARLSIDGPPLHDNQTRREVDVDPIDKAERRGVECILALDGLVGRDDNRETMATNANKATNLRRRILGLGTDAWLSHPCRVAGSIRGRGPSGPLRAGS